MDVRRNFTKMGQSARQRVIEAIKWMKDNDRTGVNGATVLKSSDPGFQLGGLYQRYVLFHAQGEVTADLSDFAIGLIPEPADTLHSVVIDTEEWVSTAKHPATEAGLRAFLNDIPLSGAGAPLTAPDIGGQSGGPFHVRSVDPPVPLPIVIGHIDNCPFGDIKVRTMPSGSTTPSDLTVTRTVRPGVRYQLDTFQMAHRSPAFLPWHRVFLRLFERDLQFADKQRGNDGKITLPYWNWIRDTDLDETSKSSVWHKENFGGFTDTAAGTITGDHFSPPSGWKLFDLTRTLLTGADGELRRRRISQRTAAGGAFPTVTTAKPVVNNAVYRSPTGGRQFAGRVEQELHDIVHIVVGGPLTPPPPGQMSNALFSPQDPIFWLFHCYLDRIWSRWQWFYDKSLQYPRFGMLPGRRRNDPMQPWAVFGPPAPPYEFNVRNRDVLNAANFSSAVNSNNLLGKGYRYDSLKL